MILKANFKPKANKSLTQSRGKIVLEESLSISSLA